MTNNPSLPLRASLVMLAMCASSVMAQQKVDFAKHPFFKHLVGEWKAEGELNNEAKNQPVTITQEWTGRVTSEGEIIFEGTRVINDGEPEKYRWTISHNPSTDLYEATLLNPDDTSNSIRFEGIVTDSPLAFERRAQLGNGGGSIIITDTFTGKGHNTLTSKVTFLTDAGGPNLEGMITHKRVK